MRAPLTDYESYAVPPRLGSGVFVGIKGVVHVVRDNHGIRVRMYCTDTYDRDVWVQYNTLDQGWFEFPTCVRCALHPGAINARVNEIAWRTEWQRREGKQLRAPREVEPSP